MDYQERLGIEIINEDASIWFYYDGNSEPFVLIKAPINSIKSLVKGCQVEIVIGKDIKVNPSILHVGIKIYDDLINPLLLTGANRFVEENQGIEIVLKNSISKVALYSELGMVVASGNLIFDPETSKRALTFIGDIRDLYTGEFTKQLIKSLDCFDYSLDKTREFDNVHELDLMNLSCQFTDLTIVNSEFIGLNAQKETNIGSLDEGITLEKHVWFSIESLFNYDIYLNPQFKSKDHNKELTDILAFHHLGIFLIETKCLSIFSSGDNRSMSKKTAVLKKHIRKAIKQLSGACRNIQQGTDILSESGEKIEFKRDIVPHCIVLVAELFQFGVWSDTEKEILETVKREGFILNVLDFREFVKIVKHSKMRKEYLDYYLMLRFENFVKSGSIFLRSEFKNE